MKVIPQIPGLAITEWGQYPGARFENYLAGEAMVRGDVVVLDPTAALNAGGKQPTVKLTTSANDKDVLGVVADRMSTIKAGGQVTIQIAGLHPGVNCDGTTDLATGDLLGTFTTKGAAQKATDSDSRAFGTYVDAVYITNAVAKKKVWLRNPMGIVPRQIS